MSKYKNIIFRTDSSSDIGIGHIMRDLVLASKYKNSNIIFATQDLDGNINYKIKEAGYKLNSLKSNSKKELVKLIKELNIDFLVIDHYRISYKKEKYIKEKTNVKILSFDDTYEKHYCDILLNHNIGAKQKKYKTLVPSTCKIKCGSKYTLIRDEFYEEKNKNYKKSNNIHVFLAMGGSDYSNINISILKVLKKFKNLKINVVTTKANKNLDKLQKYVKNKNWIFLHVDTQQIAKLMKTSNFAIITPSVILNEVYFMKIPFIAIQTVKNQKDIYKYLKNKKFLVIKKFNYNKLKNKLKILIGNK